MGEGLDRTDHLGLELGCFTDNRVFGVAEVSAVSGAGSGDLMRPDRGSGGSKTGRVWMAPVGQELAHRVLRSPAPKADALSFR